MSKDCVKPRDLAPHFTVMAFNDGLQEIKLTDFANQYIMLLFFPHGTPVCATESAAFSNHLPKFYDHGCIVLGCTVASPQDIFGLKNIPIAEGGVSGIKFPILCDEKGDLCKAYGALDNRKATRRALVIIDRNLEVRHFSISDMHVGRSVKTCLDLLYSYQQRDKLRLGLPISWPEAEFGNICMECDVPEKID